MENNLLERIVVNPEVMAGKPVVNGTRIPVDLILRLLGEGTTIDEILEDYPHLTIDDIRASLIYGSEIVKMEDVFPLVVGVK